jgi:anti-anti-sigma factor
MEGEQVRMDIVVSQEQARVPVTVFHIRGEIDIRTSDQLEAQAREAFEDGMRDLLLDLSGVPYISSAGLRALHYIFTLLRADSPGESEAAMYEGLRGGTFKSPHFKLLDPQPAVMEALRTAGYDMYLEIHRSLKGALASF